jgi:hypothetical protein
VGKFRTDEQLAFMAREAFASHQPIVEIRPIRTLHPGAAGETKWVKITIVCNREVQ